MNKPTHPGKHTSNTTNCEPNVLTFDEPVPETRVVKSVQIPSTDNITLEPVLTNNPNVNGPLCEISDGYDTSDTTADLLDSFDFSVGKVIDTFKKVKDTSSTATVKTAVTNTTATSSNNENINSDKTKMLNPAPDDDTPLQTDQTEEYIEDKASSEHPVQSVRSCEKLPGTDQTENKTEVTQEDPIRKTVKELYQNLVQVECKFELEKLSEKDIQDWMTKENLSVTKGFQIIMKTPVKTETKPITKSVKNENKLGDDAVDPSANVTATGVDAKEILSAPARSEMPGQGNAHIELNSESENHNTTSENCDTTTNPPDSESDSIEPNMAKYKVDTAELHIDAYGTNQANEGTIKNTGGVSKNDNDTVNNEIENPLLHSDVENNEEDHTTPINSTENSGNDTSSSNENNENHTSPEPVSSRTRSTSKITYNTAKKLSDTSENDPDPVPKIKRSTLKRKKVAYIRSDSDSDTLPSTGKRKKSTSSKTRYGPSTARIAARNNPSKLPKQRLLTSIKKSSETTSTSDVAENTEVPDNITDVEPDREKTPRSTGDVSTNDSDSKSTSSTMSMTTPATSPNRKTKGTFDLNIHGFKKYRRKRTFKCKKCDHVENTLAKLNKHYSAIHDRVRCNVCGRPFVTPSALRKHMYTHKELPHKCDKCPKAYAFASQLKSHKVSHRTLCTYQCIHCKKYLKNESDLVKHLKVHDGILHECDLCDYSNMDIRNLTAHMKSMHTFLKRYICKYCGVAFKHFNQRTRHLAKPCPRMPTTVKPD